MKLLLNSKSKAFYLFQFKYELMRKDIDINYLWIHKLQILVFSYVFLFSLGKYFQINNLIFSYPLVLIFYLLFSKKIDSFLLDDWPYIIMMIFSGGMLIGLRPGPGRKFAQETVFNFYGYFGIFLLLFVFINGWLVSIKVFRYSWYELTHGRKN